MSPADESADTFALADRFFAAIEAGDLDAVAACWTEDVVTWTNFAGETGREQSLKVLGWLMRKADGLRYDVVRREAVEGGFLQQHVLRGTAPDGTEVEMPACLVVTVRDGLVARIDEYLDPAATAPFSRSAT